jgi:hypothetical protein
VLTDGRGLGATAAWAPDAQLPTHSHPQDALLDAAIEGDMLDFDSFASLVAGPAGSTPLDELDFYDARAPAPPPAGPPGMLLGGGLVAG